ncbi:50S ribosomal protein L3 glutamine methyltransferase [Francisella halioticida]|uniref:Ribosomal protein uL3 glutamine methyltransferase n=1 Tax=Francisella halioticida TaxID=549298 RepID=A0ABM6M199_9GAMM|nr:50S ribosomal protein L3 N(5)-glutamine methyltransferase [Francisella halioticida]ASG68732.1 50S ribosomal protein L3 N(5)-glutamine methyltransferase [Francisella halioticida]BCD91682.1 50S ribosomal protein L3 glutamine methyltransferase [Francisella halioticida]
MYSQEKQQDIINNLHTIRDYIRWCISEMSVNQAYFGHGSDSVWDEAVHLVLSAINVSYDIDSDMVASKLLMEEKQRIIGYVYQRACQRKPLPYILKKAWFAGMEFDIDERVIIPRSPIAELIGNDFAPWVNDIGDVKNVLDLCTGSGCIGIASTTVFEDANITLVDISDDALAIANHNIKKHQITDRVQAVKSDLFANLKGQRFDVIVSNPPYVDKEDLDSMPKEYHYEPRLALEAGDDGLDLAKKIILEADLYMTENGVLIVEVGNSQYTLIEMCPDIPFTWLSFSDGGDGVFLLTYEELVKYKDLFKQYFSNQNQLNNKSFVI